MSTRPLADLFEDREYSYGFFQTVRLLELCLANGEEQRIGRGRHPDLEPARFQSRVSLSFPPSEIAALGFDLADASHWDRRSKMPRKQSFGAPVSVTVGFMGLTGALGVLPLPYSELVLKRLRRGDRALRDFFDLLGHRFISFFYRAWAKHRPGIDHEWCAARASSPGGRSPLRSRFLEHLASLVGLGLPSLHERLPIGDEQLLRYVPLLLLRTRPAVALKELLADFLELRDELVDIAQFVAQELTLSLHEQSVLGDRHAELGISAVCGDAIVVHDSKFEVVLGPLSRSQFATLLPPGTVPKGGAAFCGLVALTRLFVGPELDFDVRLVLTSKAVCTAVLGEDPPMLGVSFWLINQPPETDLRDSVFPDTAAKAAPML